LAPQPPHLLKAVVVVVVVGVGVVAVVVGVGVVLVVVGVVLVVVVDGAVSSVGTGCCCGLQVDQFWQ